MSAKITALATIELLEKILLLLDIVDLSLAKRVSPLWHSCIRGSPLLRRKLFQEAILATEAPAIQCFRQYRAQPVAVNPLLQNDFRVRHSEISGSSIAMAPPRRKKKLLQREVSESVLRRDSEGYTIRGLRTRPIILDTRSFYNETSRRRRRPSWDLSNSEPPDPRISMPVYTIQSWASMLVTQPPLRKLNLHCDYIETGLPGGVKVLALDERGVTMGDMMRAAAEFHRRWEQQDPDGYRFDVQMTIYQPLEVQRSNDGTLVWFANGMRHSAESDEEIGFQRAWNTKLRCTQG